jgi:hypothetical protein
MAVPQDVSFFFFFLFSFSKLTNNRTPQGQTSLTVGFSGSIPDASPRVAHTAGNTQRNAHVSIHAGHTHDAQPKTRIGKRLKAVERQQEMINTKTKCTYCGSALSLLRRPVRYSAHPLHISYTNALNVLR